MEIRVWNFKITGIEGIHAIPLNLKSLYSDFPAKSLQFPLNICSVGSELLGKEIKERFEHWMRKDKNF